MTTSFNVGLFGKADISPKNVAMSSTSGVSNFGFRFPEQNSLSSTKNTNTIETDDDLWDQQIEADFLSGKFDQLIKEAREEYTQGKAIEI